MKDFNGGKLLEQADPELLKQLIHQLATKDPFIKRECLDFLQQKINLPPHVIPQVATEKMWALWEELVADLSELDEYGGGSDDTVDQVSDWLSQIEELLKEHDISKEERMTFLEELLPFIQSGNAGMDDALHDAAYAACKDHEDWEYLAESFEKIGGDWLVRQAMKIYRKIGEQEKYLKLRAKKMIYGRDYYDLVTFYSERGDKNRALALAQDGMIKGEGCMEELREFMANHFSESGNRSEFLKIQFMQATDSLYLASYEKFKKECSPAEWQEYEPQILKILEKTSSTVQLKIRMFRQEYEQALHLLQKIGYPSHSWDASSILQEATGLETKFPKQILEFYQQGLGSFAVNAKRKVYIEQARVALKIRHLLINVMNQPEKWKAMLQEMKFLNKRRKSFFEEFSKIIPDWNIAE